MRRDIRGHAFDVIEDVFPILDVKVSVRAPRQARRVTLAPQRQELRFSVKAGRVNFIVPGATGHQMVVLDLRRGGRGFAQPATRSRALRSDYVRPAGARPSPSTVSHFAR